MGFKQTATHRYGKGSFHQIGLVRGQFGNVPMAKWVAFVQETGFDGWEEAGWELDLDKCLTDAGADILHCSQRRFWEPEFEGSDLNFAGWAKKLTGKPTITVGSIGLSGEFVAAFAGESSKPASLDELLRRLDRGDFDLVGVGRALLQDPQWAVKVHEGRTDELMDFDRSAMMSLS